MEVEGSVVRRDELCSWPAPLCMLSLGLEPVLAVGFKAHLAYKAVWLYSSGQMSASPHPQLREKKITLLLHTVLQILKSHLSGFTEAEKQVNEAPGPAWSLSEVSFQ